MTNWQDNLKRILANHKMKKGGSSHKPSQLAAPDSDNPGTLHLDDAAVVKLMRCLSMSAVGACTCAEAFAMLDQYTELVASDEQAQQLMPLVKKHMDICPDCRQEFEILLTIIHAESGENVES